MWFDPKAALAKIESEAGPPATSATSATLTVENGHQVAEVAEVAAPQPAQRILAALPILLAGRPSHELVAAKQAVTAFLDNHLEAARCIGWSDLELFGCYPVRDAARNRYDYAGAVILAAMSGHSIEQITVLAAHYENGLAYYRRPMPADAVPVWELGKTHGQVHPT